MSNRKRLHRITHRTVGVVNSSTIKEPFSPERSSTSSTDFNDNSTGTSAQRQNRSKTKHCRLMGWKDVAWLLWQPHQVVPWHRWSVCPPGWWRSSPSCRTSCRGPATVAAAPRGVGRRRFPWRAYLHHPRTPPDNARHRYTQLVGLLNKQQRTAMHTLC